MDPELIKIQFRRLPNLLGSSIRNGPDGTWDRTPNKEAYIQQAIASYLVSNLSFLEGHIKKRCWEGPGISHSKIDDFLSTLEVKFQTLSEEHYLAMHRIRNAAVHNNYIASSELVIFLNSNTIPGVSLDSSNKVILEEDFLEYFRKACIALLKYHGVLV